MTAQFARPAPFDDDRYLEEQSLKNKRFGLQIWRFANAGVFVFFIFANYLIRQTQAQWPPEGVARLDATLPAIISVLLLLSTFPATMIQRAIRRDDRAVMQRNILITIVSGLVFLGGLGLVWRQIPYSGVYSSLFYVMTGFHAVHVIAGMLLFGYVYRNAQRGAYSSKSYWGVEGAVVFWHFIEIMWVVYFVVLYLL